MPSRPAFARRRAVLASACAALVALSPMSSHAQPTFPSKPVTLVVPYPPGALTDLLGRAIAQRLGEQLKVPVVVENKAGAGTMVGAEYVAKQAPDGHTLLMATSTTLGISPAIYPNPPIDPVRDFAPIAQVGYVNFFLIANRDFPAKDVAGFIDAVRKAPGKYNYGSVGNGSPHQLFMEVLKKQYGLDIQHVPYKGTAAALPDLLTGKIQVMFADATIAVPNIQAGKVTALGTSAAAQNSLIASVPPVARTVAGFDWLAWQGVVAPAKTPSEVVSRLAAEMRRMQETTEFREQLVKFGMEPSPPGTPEEFAAIVRSDLARWSKAVKDSGAKVD